MSEVFENPERAEQWEAAREGHMNWEEVFDGYRATVDWPGAARPSPSQPALALLYLLSRTSPRRA